MNQDEINHVVDLLLTGASYNAASLTADDKSVSKEFSKQEQECLESLGAFLSSLYESKNIDFTQVDITPFEDVYKKRHITTSDKKHKYGYVFSEKKWFLL